MLIYNPKCAYRRGVVVSKLASLDQLRLNIDFNLPSVLQIFGLVSRISYAQKNSQI